MPLEQGGIFDTGTAAILARAGHDEQVLQCGTHVPRDEESYKELIRKGGELTPIYSNCSGKHAGMVATAVHMGEDVETAFQLHIS